MGERDTKGVWVGGGEAQKVCVGGEGRGAHRVGYDCEERRL